MTNPGQDPDTPAPAIPTDREFHRRIDLRQYLSPDDLVKLEHLKQECEAELTSDRDRDFTQELGWLYDQYGP